MEVKAYGLGGCYLAAGTRGMRVEEILVTHVVTENCINCKYTDCVEVCPVDCFHAGPNMLVIDPDECIDCTLCIEECPVDAIFPEEEVPPGQEHFLELNRQLAPNGPCSHARSQSRRMRSNGTVCRASSRSCAADLSTNRQAALPAMLRTSPKSAVSSRS